MGQSGRGCAACHLSSSDPATPPKIRTAHLEPPARRAAPGVDPYLNAITFDVRKAKHWRLLGCGEDHLGECTPLSGRQQPSCNNRLGGGTDDPQKREVDGGGGVNGRQDEEELGGGPCAVAGRHGRRVPRGLSEAALATLSSNGFVVLGRHWESFGAAFHDIYADDLPVFVAADALLHAWAASWRVMADELEGEHLREGLAELVGGMHAGVGRAARALAGTRLEEAVREVDVFLTVAGRLLNRRQMRSGRGARWGCACGMWPSGRRVAQQSIWDEEGPEMAAATGDHGCVDSIMDSIQEGRRERVHLLGRERDIDFGALVPRGRRGGGDELRRYFRGAAWCAQARLDVGGSSRELACAVVMLHLVQRGGLMGHWYRLEAAWRGIGGVAGEAVTYPQLEEWLGEYWAQAHIRSMKKFAEGQHLHRFQQIILKSAQGGSAVSNLPGCHHDSPSLGSLPVLFTPFGQSFAVDAAASANMFQEEAISEDGALRSALCCLDVCASISSGFSDMANATVELGSSDAVRHAKLLTARWTITQQRTGAGSNSMESFWLRLLHVLSHPTTSQEYPQAMRTRAWAFKDAETQIASWAQLRNDAVPSPQEARITKVNCDYPAGYVDPRPEFWHAFLEMVNWTRDLFHRAVLDSAGYSQFLRGWQGTLQTLEGIARKERMGRPMSLCEEAFLKSIVRDEYGAGGALAYSGWYCRLFYGGREDSCRGDYIVTEAHRQRLCPCGEGGIVVQEGVGKPAMMTIAIDSGRNLGVYVGPVFSHYELCTVGSEGVGDADWRRQVQHNDLPAQPKWKVHRVEDD